jgi:TolA-binding protein
MLILLLGLGAEGCRKEVVPAAPELPPPEKFVPAPSAITPPEPLISPELPEPPRPEITAPPEIFVEAERNFAAGNYRQAANAFEKFLNNFPKDVARDSALFHFAFSLALSGGDRDLIQTEAALRRLILEFPKSPYRHQAEWILSLKAQVERLQSYVRDRDERIRQLSEELNKLKSIDLERRPSRPE